MKIAIGADHAGYEVKQEIGRQLTALGHDVIDVGTNSPDSVDYPDFGRAVGELVASETAARGIVVCGSGIGIAIAANKVRGVRAAQAWNEETARLSREHNDANVLSIGARVLPAELIPKIVSAWLTADYAGGRHGQRIEKISALEKTSA